MRCPVPAAASTEHLLRSCYLADRSGSLTARTLFCGRALSLLRYYRKRCKEWRITSHIFSFLKSVDVADDALQGKLYHLGGQGTPLQPLCRAPHVQLDRITGFATPRARMSAF